MTKRPQPTSTASAILTLALGTWLEFPTEPALVSARQQIEALADVVQDVTESPFEIDGRFMWAKTSQGKFFTTISNGKIVPEGGCKPEYLAVERLAKMTVSAAKSLRRRINGPARLTWRAFSHHPEDKSLWVRLAFEPL